MYTKQPIIAMLHNTKEDRWHPIIFLESPLPGPPDAAQPVRHKSKNHHTAGFATRAEALSSLTGPEGLVARIGAMFGKPETCLEEDIPWDGEGIPAMVAFFVEVDGKLQIAF